MVQAVASTTDGDVIPIDGKKIRRNYDNHSGMAAIHMVSAWSSRNGLVLGQEKTEEKSNEITAIPKLLELLEIKGCIVTIDAIGCQTEIAEKIVKKKADYFLAVKGNQGNLHAEIKEFFACAQANNFKNVEYEYHEESDLGHGRIEYRECWVLRPDVKCFSNLTKWKNLTSIIMIKSKRELSDKVTNDT